MFLNHFDMLIKNIILKKKKKLFNVFLNKKNFKSYRYHNFKDAVNPDQ